VSERYTETAIHFDIEELPPLLTRWLPARPVALADLGCGDGPLFAALSRKGLVSSSRPVYAVDLEAARLARVSNRFPWIRTLVASADAVPDIPDGALDAVISTMVMEHVPDEHAYLAEIQRMLRPNGRAYVTTVFKQPWAWYFRKRNGESVLDTSHLREYTDLDRVRELVANADLRILAMKRSRMWFPLLDPLLFRAGPRMRSRPKLLRALRSAKVPIPGYYVLELVVER
jgi:2-polyprenyl-3-methyl-5-hydroxy-6-metoxy-1,4-benzoquinol methylase